MLGSRSKETLISWKEHCGSATLARMGRRGCVMASRLQNALMIAALICAVEELNDVQETYSKLVEWIEEWTRALGDDRPGGATTICVD
jgi:hypothetical protein